MDERIKEILMKKNKLIIIILLSIILLIPAIMYFMLDIKLIGDREYEQTVNEKYFDSGCRASIFGMPLEVKESSNVDTSKIGDYEVEYTAHFAFINKSVKRTVHVLDNVKPDLVLNGSNELFLGLDEEYEEPGFSANDNYDGDLTDKVLVEGKVDNSKEGIYEIKYSVKDSSDNTREVIRKIEVKKNNALSLSIKDFWLEDIFPEIILKPQEEEIDYFDDVVLLGDSNTWFLYKWSHLIKAEQCWGKRNLNIAEINSSVFTNYVDEKERTLKESIELYHPEYLIISPGIGSPLFMKDTEKYKVELKNCIEYLRTEHPEITFAFSAILPINEGQLYKEFQKEINIYNYYLAEICHNYKVNLINFADTIRDEEGYAIVSKMVYNPEKPEDQGFHLSEDTRRDYIDYLKHIDLRRVIE